jgi:branched-chain amino acid transport system ATP-binding protein
MTEMATGNTTGIALTAVGLSKHFGGLKAVSNVSLEAHLGEVHAVIGPNGAGKTTLINLISGDLKPTAGTILIGDADITHRPQHQRGLAGVGRSYQKTTIFFDFTVLENVRLAVQARSRRPLWLFGRAEADSAVVERAEAALETVGLLERAAMEARALSHGEQRQLEIAMVLASAPKIMLLDEPLAGMGTGEARAIVELIARLKAQRAVLLVEHDMDAVFALADRLTVMADGQVIASGLPAEVRTDPAVRAAYLGASGL